MREKELENQPEPDHTDVLNEQLAKAAEETQKLYKEANKGAKTRFILNNKKSANDNRERIRQNERLVKSIAEI